MWPISNHLMAAQRQLNVRILLLSPFLKTKPGWCSPLGPWSSVFFNHTAQGNISGQNYTDGCILQWLLILQEYTVPSRCSIAGSVLSISILLPCKKVCTYMKFYVCFIFHHWNNVLVFLMFPFVFKPILQNFNCPILLMALLNFNPFLRLQVMFQWIIRCLGKSQAS